MYFFLSFFLYWFLYFSLIITQIRTETNHYVLSCLICWTVFVSMWKTQTFNFTFNELKPIKWALMVLSACCPTRRGSQTNRRIRDGRATPEPSTGWGSPGRNHTRGESQQRLKVHNYKHIHHNKGGAARALSWLQGSLVWQRSGDDLAAIW